MTYDETFVKGLEFICGDGYLSPGGITELSEILIGTDIRGKTVLDIGCAIGGWDRVLVSTYEAKRVIGIDVQADLIARAIEDTKLAGLMDKIEFRVVEPGPLDFPDEFVDIVFSKDALMHIKERRSIYEEIFRILRPGGILVGNDWLGNENSRHSDLVRNWLDFAQIKYYLWTPAEIHGLLEGIGFESINLRDRSAWYSSFVEEEVKRLSREENQAKLAEVIGEKNSKRRLQSSKNKKKVVDAGELRPTIFRAVKP